MQAFRNLGEARHVLRSAFTADPENAELLLASIDFELEHGTPGVSLGVSCQEKISKLCPQVRTKSLHMRMNMWQLCLNIMSKI